MFLGKIPTQSFSSGTCSIGNSQGSLVCWGSFFSKQRQLDSFSQQMPIFSHLGDIILSPTSFFPQKQLLVMFWFTPLAPWSLEQELLKSSWRLFLKNLWWVWACLKSFVPYFRSFFSFWQPALSCKLYYCSYSGLLSPAANYLLDFSTLIPSFLFFTFISLHMYSVLPSTLLKALALGFFLVS